MTSNEFLGMLVTALIALAGLISVIVGVAIKPLINLNRSIEKLSTSVDRLDEQYEKLNNRVDKTENAVQEHELHLVKHDEEIKNIEKDLSK